MYTGFVNSQTLANSGVTGSASLSTTATAYDGSTAGSASVVGNYLITASAGTLAASNYQFSYGNATLAVAKANLTIVAANDSKTYGDSITAANITYIGNGLAANVSTGYTTSGLVNGDSISGVDLQSNGYYTTATVAGGPYSITPNNLRGSNNVSAANYNITYRNAPTGLTVNSKALTVTANAQSTTYGTALVLGTTAYTTSGLVNGDRVTEVTLKLGQYATVEAYQAAGTYTNQIMPSLPTGTGLLNYSITYVPATLTVNPKLLTITAQGRSTTYGTALVLGTTNFNTSGLVNSDSISAVTLKHGTNTTVPATQAAGTYTNGIVASSATGTGVSNYSITYVPASLAVDQKSLTVTASAQSSTYGTALTLGNSAFTTTGLVNTDTVSAVTLRQAGNSTVPATQNAGSYTGATNGIIASTATGIIAD